MTVGPDRQAAAAREAADVRILQRVNHLHRDAFEQRYPTQVTHCLRLTMERMQLSLEKRGNEIPGDPTTWRLASEELAHLAETAYYLDQIRRGF